MGTRLPARRLHKEDVFDAQCSGLTLYQGM